MRAKSLFFLFLSAALAGCNSSSDTSAPPLAQFSYSCVDFVCTFDASETTTPGGGTIFYAWDFGDDTGSGGKIARHAYTESGSMKVILRATNSKGATSSKEQTVAVTGNAAAKYYNPIHDSLALLLLMEDTITSIHATGDALQEAAEFHGPAVSDYVIDCTAGGTARIVSWTNTNGNLVIDGEEALEFEADECTFTDDGDALTSTGFLKITGDFDSNSFSIGKSTAGTNRFQVAQSWRWPVQGLISVTATRTGDAIDQLAFSSTNLKTFRVSSSNSVELELATPVSISTAYDTTTGISGDLKVTFPGGTTTYEAEIVSPLDIVTVTGGLRLAAGEISILSQGNRVDVSPDTDPAYLIVEVDTGNDGDIDIDTRFPQSVTVERLEN